MTTALIGLAIFTVLVLGGVRLVETFRRSSPTGKISTAPAFRKKESIMNKSERAFFYELQKQLPNGYHIFPNMRIADILTAVDGEGFYKRRNMILPKHIDFLICDSYFRPKIAVEVNGSSHRRPDRMERDELVKRIFAEAQLPLEFVDVGTDFALSIEKLKKQLSENL